MNRIDADRSKLAHDLHDGLLQTLTAAALQLKVCSKNCQGDTRHELNSIQQLLAAEQKRIRVFVSGWDRKNGSKDFVLASACKVVLTETRRILAL